MFLSTGAIFSENNTGLDERVFKFAVDSINTDNFLSNITLLPVVKFAALENSFENIYRGKLKKLGIFFSDKMKLKVFLVVARAM